MGNQPGRENHVPTGSPLDFFQTPPTTPTQAELTAMALSSAASPDKTQTPSPPGGGGGGGATPSSSSAAAAAASPASEWAVLDGDAAEKAEAAAAVSLGSASDASWQERDSGLEPQAAAERAGDEMTLVLLSLMEHYRDSLGLTPNTDVTTGAVELLRRLITEREGLVEEVDTLRETLRTERLEWQQFQSDLQVAVSVADRLRVESEQALGSLQESHRAAEERRRETERELDGLRAEHRDVCRKLTELQQRPDAPRDACEDGDGQAEETEKLAEDADKEADAEGAPESGDTQPKGKGVAESYLRRLAALEKKKEDGRGPRDPRKILMLTKRSWSLSRLPLPSDGQKDASKNTSTTLPLCKKEPTNGRRPDRALKRQDSWSNFYTGKQDEDQSSESIRPQDGFSALLRRHGGSRRNSLLRWCQSRTQGYKNIEITNFSSSWEDGLAFCAVYHTYLPARVPFDSLNPADKKENLDFAFKTGETLGITATLTVEEMLKAGGPDWQRVLGYVESIFRHFEM